MKIKMLSVHLFASFVVVTAHASDSQPGHKTRAEVIAEMQKERASGELYKLDYYPVYERSWREDSDEKNPATSRVEDSHSSSGKISQK